MQNAERFLVAFNKIEKHFDKILSEDRYIPFHRAVHQLKKRSAVINRYHQDLLEYSELRNAIVHERTEMNYAIADPYIDTVKAIEWIAEQITAPKQIIPTFEKKLKVLQADLELSNVLAMVKETEYSQFPVYQNEQFIGLLTDKTLLHWIAQQMNGDIQQLLRTKVMEIAKDVKKTSHYRFVPKTMDIYQAEALFIDNIKKHQRLDALLITEEGKANQNLLGMVSPHDLIDIP